MTKQQICPNCRSTLEAQGNLNLSAPAMQSLNCPVCAMPISLSSGFPAVRWNDFSIIQRNEPVRLWEQIKQDQPEFAAAIEKIPEDQQKSVLKDFSVIPDSLAGAVQSFERKTLIVGVFIVVILALVLAIKLKK